MQPGPATRVVLLPEYRATPPARLFREEAPPAPPGEPNLTLDVEYERRILSDAETRGAGAAGSNAAGDALLSRVQAFAAAAEQHVRPGLSEEDVRLAAAMVGDARDNQKVLDFAVNCAQLRGMGFAPEVVCGALLQTDNDLESAASRCLSG